jgi:hypothetical protein
VGKRVIIVPVENSQRERAFLPSIFYYGGVVCGGPEERVA